MAIRISCAIRGRGFRAGGLVVGPSWTEIKELTPGARASLVAHYGRFVRIHPADLAKLGEIGLSLEDGKLVEARAPKGDAKPITPITTPTTKTDAPKGDASGKADAKKER